MKKRSPLTAKQEAFIREYQVDLNATQAAIRAGYAPKSAKRQAFDLMRNPLIADAIKNGQQEKAEQLNIDAHYVLSGLKREAEFRGDGAKHSARVAALTQLGKHLGLFTDKVQHSGSIDHNIELPDLKSMSNEQLNAFIAYQRAMLGENADRDDHATANQ